MPFEINSPPEPTRENAIPGWHIMGSMSRDDGSRTAGLSTSDAQILSSTRRELPPELPLLTLLWHPDPRRVGERLVLAELLRGRAVAISRRGPNFAQPHESVGRPLQDSYLSRAPFHLRPGVGGSIELDPIGSRTRIEVDGKVLTGNHTFAAEDVARGVPLELAGRVALLLSRGRPSPGGLGPKAGAPLGMVGASEGIEKLRTRLLDVADLDIPVLLRGATGTGKELAARALHQHGKRANGPFVAVNLGALAPNLAAAELFGAKKGSYTGAAQDRAGYFAHADGGTLFLDEVGEAPLDVQVMLLRALETGEVVPVGARVPRRVDARIVAATDADLDRLVATGAFRAPLYHRLAGYEIHLPTLAERRDDLGRLLVHFLRLEARAMDEPDPIGEDHPWLWLSARHLIRLARHTWPGNIRQLHNIARQLAVLGRRVRHASRENVALEEATEEIDHLLDLRLNEGPGESAPEQQETSTWPRNPAKPTVLHRSPKDISEAELLTALAACRWRLKPTAEHLGISRTSLYALIDRCPGIRRAGDLDREELAAAWSQAEGNLDLLAELLKVSSHGLRQRLRELGIGT